jgi:60 kDa SS-A/Ro ribonucleoprotein
MKKMTRHVSTRVTPQSQPIPGSTQVANSAGGYSYEVSPWTRLNRFLILGSEGGTYYISEQKLTVDNAKNVIDCIKADGPKVVQTIVDVSLEGRAYRNDPAIFALALCCAHGDEATRKAAYASITKVCRIGTHLFHFAQAIQDLHGKWSRGLRSGVSAFYENRKPESLAGQLVKYRQRDGWTHRDVMRLAHPSVEGQANAMLRWAVDKEVPSELLAGTLIEAFQKVQTLKATKEDVQTAVKLIRDNELPREALPTELLKEVPIWEALLEHMPIMAMIRNLGVMTSNGLLKSALTDSVKKVVATVTDEDVLRKGRIHPMGILLAMTTYAQGHGGKGNKTWTPVRAIVDALDTAFYTSFKTVEPTGQNWLLALDVSGSMSSPISGTALSCREGAAAMALVTARVEPAHEIIGFTSGGTNKFSCGKGKWSSMGYGNGVSKLDISPKMSLEKVVDYTRGLDFGGTDCSLPILYAAHNDLKVDTFVVYTDSETWAGNIHPTQALKAYRKEFNPDAKLIVVGMEANEFTIADPNDRGMLDVVGFDASAPRVISDFSKGIV